MANIFSNPWDEERQRKLRSPFTGVRPYQPSLSPGGAYGQIWDGNTGMGMMPGPSTPPGGPAPLPPNIQTPNPGNTQLNTPADMADPITGARIPRPPDYGGGMTSYPKPVNPGIPGGEIPGTQQPISPGIPGGIINPPNQGGGYSGGQWEGLDMSGFNPTGPQTMDMSPYTINGETYYGSSSWASKLQEYLNSTGQGDAFGRPDTSIGFQQPRQGPPNTKFSPPGPPGGITRLPSPPNAGTGGPLPPGGPRNWIDMPNPPGGITPLPSPPNAGTGGPLPPGGGINRPSRPSNPPDYRLAQPSPGRGHNPDSGWRLEADPSLLPPLPDMGHIKPVPLQGQGYNRATTSSPSPSPAWAVNKTKRTF